METPRNLQIEESRNVSDLITHLWKLYYDMSLDPALAASAEHVRKAALELEETRRIAWEVYREEQAAHAASAPRKPRRRRKKETESAADWLRDVPPASPLKQ
jgi:hypothetical protein